MAKMHADPSSSSVSQRLESYLRAQILSITHSDRGS
uniref:Uncharacterized protein n=1 Tax=Anguilla anguilla TaxID=7936 RepID=A0A0E9SYM3_ANGAN